MALVIYDMDETLLDADCSTLWIEYLIEQGMADRDEILQKEKQLMQDYYQGNLKVEDYVTMQLKPTIGLSFEELEPHLERYVAEKIRPVIRQQARTNIARHKEQGDRCLIISASTEFLIQPIARELGIEDIIGIEIEIEQGRITGNISGIPSYQEGKVTRLEKWLSLNTENMNNSWFYSDSHNDRPLLEKVTNPVAVNADEKLSRLATANGWLQVCWQ
ncbi:HAD family hydrolase [Oceanospirillum sediminis]|uniref:HAD family hydrolase n=1 Tax=Oceanospirillum sediminis TaxID=2760088 RepID=A0A839IUQ5_9GAMM|nr:HAD family hydrolase [Oceanospirillum sediminis]MBB1489183.1 HAD family hydrolase [Oceanospirillum sediminis]